MAQFNYKAVDKNGKAKKGTIDAADREKAQEKLKSEGLAVTELKDAGEAKASFSLGKNRNQRCRRNLPTFLCISRHSPYIW